MKNLSKSIFLLFSLCICLLISTCQSTKVNEPSTESGEDLATEAVNTIDYDGFVRFSQQISNERRSSLLNLERFNQMAVQPNTIILDSRSRASYDEMHMEGAIHVNLSDFTKSKLRALIPDTNTAILIYCNNNIESESPSMAGKIPTMALNITTHINLKAYGYQNIYELDGYYDEEDPRLRMVGTYLKNLMQAESRFLDD